MRDFFKGLSIQLGINLIAHLVRIIIAYLIIKYGPEPQTVTSFGKDSGWQMISLFMIIIYNIISLFIAFIKFRKTNVKFLYGFCITSILGGIYALMFCGL